MENSKILIIDDDPDLSAALKATLENADYDVVTACDRARGMEAIKRDKPDLIILDVMMSTWQDGFEMAREIKKDAGLKDIRILMLTAVKEKTGIGFKSTAGDAVWLPVDGFLDKPVEPQVLLDEVRNLLRKDK
jgi:DNA-binding response OmpR family regulator